MLPNKIREFLNSLIQKTELGEYTWGFDDENSTVYLKTDKFLITVVYSFNQDEEYGQFVIFYHEITGKEYRFSTNQTTKDYELVRHLFDVAQASGMNLPF